MTERVGDCRDLVEVRFVGVGSGDGVCGSFQTSDAGYVSIRVISISRFAVERIRDAQDQVGPALPFVSKCLRQRGSVRSGVR